MLRLFSPSPVRRFCSPTLLFRTSAAVYPPEIEEKLDLIEEKKQKKEIDDVRKLRLKVTELAKAEGLVDPGVIIGFSDRKRCESVSNWDWGFCKSFAERTYAPLLDLSKAPSMISPTMQVFSKLTMDKSVLQMQNPRYDRARMYEEFGIEKVMKDLGFAPELDDAAYMAAPPAERKRMLAAVCEVNRGHNNILESNQIMVDFLGTAAREEQKPTRTEDDIDPGAQELLRLCDFLTMPLMMKTGKKNFKIFGRKCSSVADHYVIQTPNNELVLIFDDKSLREGEKIGDEGHVGEIMGELLRLLSINRDMNSFRTVFAIRYINYNVTGFRLDCDKESLETLAETIELPSKKLNLLCTVKDPETDRGLSLIDNTERGKAMELLAAVRSHILK